MEREVTQWRKISLPGRRRQSEAEMSGNKGDNTQSKKGQQLMNCRTAICATKSPQNTSGTGSLMLGDMEEDFLKELKTFTQ